jgi:uroporphyrin-3 C-methyltransferase
LWVLLAIAVLVAALLGWKAWGSRAPEQRPSIDLSPEGLDQRLLQVEASITSLRRSQESLNQSLTDTRARTGLLRDEVLAVTQRSSLLEDSVRELSAGQRSGVAALRLDEVELLLTFAQQRLRLAGDVPGAIRATELAQGVLAAQADPALLDLRQALAQELVALRAAPASPLVSAAAQLDAVELALPGLSADGALGGARAATQGQAQSGFDRLLGSLVQVRRGGGQDLLSPADRGAGEAALALEIALARSALARSDQDGLHRSAARIEGWLLRLFPDSPMLRRQLASVRRLRGLSLAQQIPMAGSTLQQLHEQQRSRREQR